MWCEEAEPTASPAIERRARFVKASVKSRISNKLVTDSIEHRL